ncbi:hypothetical protein BBJ28_00008723 [Nothophytophthora sp. Chile5]|nr:hypothetical protein BBJ28_00008723 [Nothophytophthora sp. Chile5]
MGLYAAAALLAAVLQLLSIAYISCLGSSSTVKMTVDQQNTIVFSGENPTAVVYFLHGLGDSAHGWADAIGAIAKEMPHYDIEAFVGGAGYAEGIDLTRDVLQSMFAQDVANGIPRSRIVLGGFSQGGAVSYFTGFQTKQPIGGIMVLSSFIPREKEFVFAPETADVPLLICHGDADSRARYEWATQAKQRLAAAGVKDIEFHTYPHMDHTSCPQEMQDVTVWLKRVLPATTS